MNGRSLFRFSCSFARIFRHGKVSFLYSFSFINPNERVVLSWDAIIEALVEDEYEKNRNDEDRTPTNLVGVRYLYCVYL